MSSPEEKSTESAAPPESAPKQTDSKEASEEVEQAVSMFFCGSVCVFTKVRNGNACTRSFNFLSSHVYQAVQIAIDVFTQKVFQGTIRL
jgi:hypothetical protein